MTKKVVDFVAQYMRWIEALSTCAIEGNQYAIEMLALKDTDRAGFIVEMYKLFGQEAS